MSLNVGKVWLRQGAPDSCGGDILMDASEIQKGDLIVVRMGTVIPFDGEVVHGEAMVDQASMTGESEPVKKDSGDSVFAGTVITEGELVIKVREAEGGSRYERIVKMIEDSEKLKSGVESRAEHLADRLVPYALGATALTCLITRNMTKAMSVLMVDYSCALKLAMPVTVLSAIREARLSDINVKGGKFFESISDADTIVFDKTGTLTKAAPRVKEIADITISADDLYRVVTLKKLSRLLMKRIDGNYRFIMGFNSTLIILGILGILPPATAALLHNSSTIAITLSGTRKLLAIPRLLEPCYRCKQASIQSGYLRTAILDSGSEHTE